MNSKIHASTKRTRPFTEVNFPKPMVGPSGAKLVAYRWSYEWSVKYDEREGMVDCRVSDWDGAVENEETGRLVVHQFTVEMPDGSATTVSAESVLRLLGWTSATQPAACKSMVSSAKTLAKLRMELSGLERDWQKMAEIVDEVEAKGYPELRRERRASKWCGEMFDYLVMGEFAVAVPDLRFFDYTRRPLHEKELDYAKGEYLQAQIKGRGMNFYNVKREMIDMLKRIHRQEVKMGMRSDKFTLPELKLRSYL